MIVRFDHITYVDSKNSFELKDSSDVLFSEKNLPTPDGKKKFMNHPWDDSDVFFMNQTLPVEYVLYDKTSGQSDIEVVGNTITVGLIESEQDRVCEILEAIGLKPCDAPGERVYNMRGAFDKNDVLLRFRIETFEPSKLDMKGWQCPCLLVDSVESILERLDEYSGCEYSFDHLTVNGRLLKIAFVRVSGLEPMLELISPA